MPRPDVVAKDVDDDDDVDGPSGEGCWDKAGLARWWGVT